MRSNFLKSNIHLATGKDKLRPHMDYVYFTDTHVYATDSHIAIKQCLKSFHDFTDEECKIVNGKSLNKDKFNYLKAKKNRYFKITPEGIQVIDGESVVNIDWRTEEGRGFASSIDQIIPNIHDYETSQDLGSYDLKSLEKLIKSAKHLDYKNPIISIYCKSRNNAAIVAIIDKSHSFNNYDALRSNTSLIMPVFYEDNFLLKNSIKK